MQLVTASMYPAGATGHVARDQVVIVPTHGLLAVADAPVHTDDGRAAVQLVLDVVTTHVKLHDDVLTRFRRHPNTVLRLRILGIVEEIFARAAQEMFAFARRRRGVWVTLDVVLVVGSEVFIGHVGEGRVFLVRRGLVHQLTVDHSQDSDGELVFIDADGKMRATPDSPLPRVLGPEPRVRVETLCMEAAIEDRFVVTTAHLVRAVPTHILHQRLMSARLHELAQALAGDAGTESVVGGCVQLGSGEPFTPGSAQARLALLAPMPLFSHCNDSELRVVAQATRPRQFPSGTVLFEQGQPGTELFLLIDGKVDIVKDGRQIAQLGPGSSFGEMAMLDEPDRSARAVTSEPTEVLVIPRRAFFAMLKGNPMLAVKILWNMLLRLSANLRHTSARVAELEKP